MKAFYGQRTPESSCAKNVTSRNGYRKIMQSIRITSRPPSRKKKRNQLSHFRRLSTKVITIKDLSYYILQLLLKLAHFSCIKT